MADGASGEGRLQGHPATGRNNIVPRSVLTALALGLAVLTLTACRALPGAGPERASENYRLDLGPGVVAAFVEGLTPGMTDKVAYVTHVPSGTQAVLNRDGKTIDRHDGRDNGPGRLDETLGDGAAMDRITRTLSNGKDARPKSHTITYVPLLQFGGTRYTKRWGLPSHVTRDGYRDLTADDLGPELYRVAFRISGYAGAFYHAQDGDSTHLDPGTPVHAVKGYSPEFRLGTLEQHGPSLYEADTNPLAKTGGDLLDIRGRVTAIDILEDDDDQTVLATIDEEWVIEEFVEALLAASVNQLNRDHDGPRYFLGIRLADGTAVVRAFWLHTGELSRGIMGGPELASIVSSALPADHRASGKRQ
jgi:hypothetical protein